jgi:hypothetical protein
MPTQGITFAGAFIGLPGAYYADNVSAVAPNTPPVTPPMLVLGYGWGPKPQVPVTYTSPADFQAAVRGAPVSTYIPFMANPSPALNGVQRITFIDVSRNTLSNAALLASGSQTYGTLSSVLYGPPSNQMTYQVSSGTTSLSTTARNLTVTDNYAGTQFVGTSLGVPFAIAYAGSASGGVSWASHPVSGTFQLTSPNPGESATFFIGSGGYATVSTLVEAINGTAAFAAQLISGSEGELPSLLLDTSGSTLASGAALTYGPVFALQNDMAFWVNQFANGVATMVTGTVASGGAAYLPAVTGPVFFSGATGVPPVNADYASGLATALSTPAWTVFCDSNATAVQALLAQHVEIASSPPYGMWRRGFTGSSIGDSVATTETNATNLDSLQMVYAYPGIYATNTTTGQNQLYGGLYVAAMAAAIATGNIVAEPLTNKVLNGNGVEGANAGAQLTQSQLNALQNAGVMAIWQTAQNNGPPTIVSDMTTWQVDDNIENTSSQQVACRYWLAYSVTNILRQYVGTIATPTTETNILNALKQLLNALIYTGGSSNGVLAAWDSSSLVLNYSGTQQLASISVSVQLVGQNRYITCYSSVQPLSFSIVST